MTTEIELRDLLDAEAGGPTTGPDRWEDVVRRGRHRQRVRRIRRLGAASLLASAALLAITLSSDDRKVDTTPPASEPNRAVDEGPTTPSSTGLPDVFRISAARAQGAFLTVGMLWERGAFDPCAELHPRVVESSDQVGIELVDASVQRGFPWADCGSGSGGAWGTLELEDPVGARTVVDLTTGAEIFVLDGAPILFPRELPEPFALEQRAEAGAFKRVPDAEGNLADASTWSFYWGSSSTGELHLRIGETDQDSECDGHPEDDGEAEDIVVRGTTARLCRGDGVQGPGPEGVTYLLRWQEDGTPIELYYGWFGGDRTRLSIDEVLAIAEGLEPLGG
jgi:hypothetical protein